MSNRSTTITSNTAIQPSDRPIEALTGLRIFLAVWVVTRHLFHSFGDPAFFDLGASVALFDRGYMGVDGFFILSGFILAYNYASGRAFSYRDFISARFARIYPVHFVCLLGAAAVILFKEHHLHKHIIGTDQNTWIGFVQNIFLLNAWSLDTITGWNDVAWSVSAEWFAYVFFPVLVLLVPARKRLLSMIALVLPIVALAWIEWRSPDHLSLPGGLVRLVPEFYAGVLLCRIRRLMNFARLPVVSGIVAVVVINVGVAVNSDALCVVGLGALIFALSSRADLLTRVLTVRWVVYLGEVSYCMYMIQRFPLEALSFARKNVAPVGDLPQALQFIIYMAALTAGAMAVHHLVETPARRWINARLRHRQHEQDQSDHVAEASPTPAPRAHTAKAAERQLSRETHD